MWVSTKKKLNNSLMFFQFLKKNDILYFYFTNMKQLYSKEIHESLFSSMYSVSLNNLFICYMIIQFMIILLWIRMILEPMHLLNLFFLWKSMLIHVKINDKFKIGRPDLVLEIIFEVNAT